VRTWPGNRQSTISNRWAGENPSIVLDAAVWAGAVSWAAQEADANAAHTKSKMAGLATTDVVLQLSRNPTYFMLTSYYCFLLTV
jgi:hypothetical protein